MSNDNLDLLHSLALEIEDFDAGRGSCAQPVPVGREDEGVDDVTSLKGVEVLPLVQVPEHGNAVLATRCGKRTVGGDRDGVDVAGVAVVVGLELELRKLPDLTNSKASASGDNYHVRCQNRRSEILVI